MSYVGKMVNWVLRNLYGGIPEARVNSGRVEVRVGEGLIEFCAQADESEI